MPPESLRDKIEDLIKETLLGKPPMKEEELTRLVVRKYGDGDISSTISQVIYLMEHGKHTLIRDLQGKLEYLPPKRRY